MTSQERFYIENDLKQGISISEISRKLLRPRKTISMEIKRNISSSGIYCSERAQDQADLRRSSASKAHRREDKLISTIISFIKKGLSPEQISGRLRVENNAVTASVSMIYRTVYWLEHKGEDLLKYLPRKGKKYRPKLPAGAGCKLIPNRIDIDERPAIVDDKKEQGHWEGDTVKYTDGYLVTMVERVTKITVIKKVKNKTKLLVTDALNEMMKPYLNHIKTITFDNGGEFAGHEAVSESLQCNIYFAKPYKSCQRGLNENTNGLIRRIFPKRTSIWHVTQKKLEEMVLKLNMRPRKTLNYLTPLEKFTGTGVTVMLTI